MADKSSEALITVARMYYVQAETMDAIAHHLGVSRSTVSRLLKEARESGMVRISLADHHGSASPMATALAQIFGVRVHMVSVRENANEAARFDQVARLAGDQEQALQVGVVLCGERQQHLVEPCTGLVHHHHGHYGRGELSGGFHEHSRLAATTTPRPASAACRTASIRGMSAAR